MIKSISDSREVTLSNHKNDEHFLVARYYSDEERRVKGVDMHVFQGSHHAGMEILSNGKDIAEGIKRMSVGFKIDYKLKVDFDSANNEDVYLALDSKSNSVHMRNYYKDSNGVLRPGSRGCTIAPNECLKMLKALPKYVVELNFAVDSD